MSTNESMIGRADVNDVDAILAISNTDVDAVVHAVRSNSDAIFTWDYERTRPALGKLYEKAKTSQWNANDLPWDTVVDQAAVVEANRAQNAGIFEGHDVRGTPVESWGEDEWTAHAIEAQNWTLSQFMHGEHALERWAGLRVHAQSPSYMRPGFRIPAGSKMRFSERCSSSRAGAGSVNTGARGSVRRTAVAWPPASCAARTTVAAS